MAYSKSIGLGLLLFLLHINMLSADENEFSRMHIYNRENSSIQLDIIVDNNKNTIFINKMDFKGAVATGAVSHTMDRKINLNIDKIKKRDDEIVIEAVSEGEEGLLFGIVINVLLDKKTKIPKSASMVVESSLEELSIGWNPQLLKVDFN